MTDRPTNDVEQISFAQVVWGIVCINMWAFAVFGTLFFVLGLVSFWVDVTGLQLGGEPVRTANQKFAWTVTNLAFGLLGGGFVWLQLTGRLTRHSG